VGAGDYLYTASVCSRWRGRYIKLCHNTAPTSKKHQHNLCTTRASIVVSAARLQLAFDCGLIMEVLQKHEHRLARDIAKYSIDPISVITLAKIHDMKWSGCLITRAAQANKLQLVQWLHKCGCPLEDYGVFSVAMSAVENNNLDMLLWLFSDERKVSNLPADKALEVLYAAGKHTDLTIAKWLRNEGAQRPDSFVVRKINFSSGPPNDSVMVHDNECWPLRSVQWAFANGCTWGVWQCSDFAPDEYYSADKPDKQNAAELFAWAHEKACPCTCVADAVAAEQAAADNDSDEGDTDDDEDIFDAGEE
jgi:hypothetical protein